ncbi:class F sortase [Microbacterium sp. RU33B]|uniref:class F sortase n=1 Tax=Microbacterium sp. RU33B TaxID=1907390 RepID=UPI00095E94BD|nr:class F sortase [Microbacterium sp. RU33B]SIT88187.1 LPXTG-site transpeptidase (sortase) family protein [Microbacterium sp. RU33B]
MALALAAALLSGCGTVVADAAPTAPRETPPPTPAASPTPTPTPTLTPFPIGVPPARVAIPRIDLDSPLIDLGLAADGGMEVPSDFDDVGWYAPGGRPGGRGPTVIAGHVDSATGPAIFMRLRELDVGDTVSVTDTNGTVHTYRVTKVADYAKAAFPTMPVFGATTADELRLITCGGEFDSSVGSYEDNRVVFAVRA